MWDDLAIVLRCESLGHIEHYLLVGFLTKLCTTGSPTGVFTLGKLEGASKASALLQVC